MTFRRIFWGTFWSLVGLVLIIHLGGGWYFSGVLIEDGFEPDPEAVATPSGGYRLEEVQYQSELGAMDAWYLPADGTTWVIHVHGKGGTPAQAEPLFTPIQEAGYPQLAITYRNDEGQPPDPSGYYQYGVTEFQDVSGAVRYALENGADRIVLNGYSTGAGMAMAFVFREPADRIGGVIMDAPNLDMGETVNYQAAQRDMPIVPMKVPASITAVAKFITSLRIGVNWRQLDYVDEAAAALRQPVLVHHGTADLTIPVEESIELAEVNPEMVQLILVDGAGHIESYDADPDKYVGEVLGFLDQVAG